MFVGAHYKHVRIQDKSCGRVMQFLTSVNGRLFDLTQIGDAFYEKMDTRSARLNPEQPRTPQDRHSPILSGQVYTQLGSIVLVTSEATELYQYGVMTVEGPISDDDNLW